MTSRPSPDDRLLGLFSTNEVRLMLDAMRGTLLIENSEIGSQLLDSIREVAYDGALASKWSVDWRDLWWRLSLLDETAARSLRTWIAPDLTTLYAHPRPSVEQIEHALEARPTGIGVSLSYDCGHGEGGEGGGAASRLRECRVDGPCPTCALQQSGPAAVQPSGDEHPRDTLLATRIRSRVVAELRQAPTPTPDFPVLYAVVIRYLSSRNDVAWWVENEFRSHSYFFRDALTPAILTAANRQEAEALLRSSNEGLRRLALRRIAELSAE